MKPFSYHESGKNSRSEGNDFGIRRNKSDDIEEVSIVRVLNIGIVKETEYSNIETLA